MKESAVFAQRSFRPFSVGDLETVVAIDYAMNGRRCRACAGRRLAVTPSEPRRHVRFGEGRGEERVGCLLSQQSVNRGASRLERGDRVEAILAPRDLALFGFLYHRGFAPSQRLAVAYAVQ